jgi:hypothetical protein
VSLSEQQVALRLEVARSGLAGYKAYICDLTADRISPRALADLVTSAEWLVELLTITLPRMDAALRGQLRQRRPGPDDTMPLPAVEAPGRLADGGQQ